VVQDDSGGRSFFYVGDVKQAIYRWRSGNADLFGQILRHYQGAIEQQPLDRSFRFCPPVTDAVNHVFADLPDDLPGGTVQDWRAIWRQHSCETSKVPKTGYVALIEPVYDPERSKPDAGDRYQVVASLLQELEPMTRNLSVAVLVRKNSQGSNLVQFLRSRLPGHAIVHEGSAEIAANPVCGLLLSLIEYSAHPGDTLALKHLQMSPLHTAIMATGRGYRILPLLVLERIQSQGFRGCLAHWGEELERLGGLDRYGRRKLQELLLAADRFDAANNRSCNDFLTFIKGYSYRQTAAAGSIRVMTVHQAKGLGFDVVLLPELQDGSMESGSRSDVALLTDPRSGQTSLLNLPQKIFAEADPVLAAAFAEQKKAAAFDELCTLYVAMTRAKKALYLITGYQGKNSTSFTQGALVKLQLHGEKNPPAGPADEICGHPVTLLYEKGKRRWYEEEKKQRKEPTGKPIVSLSDEYRRQASVSKMTQISPSAAAEHEKTAASLFSSGTSGSLQFGSGVHSLFEMLSWYSEAEESRAVAAWRAGNVYDTPFTEEVAAHFKAALAAPAVRKALGKPSDNALLWREREFDVVIDGHWVCGIFDRVAIEADREGRPGKATVQDYKTNRVDSRQTLHQLTEEYRPQMQLYRQALSLLLNLPQDRIDLQLIFTGIGEVVQLA
jgi:ATP-dependent helicase/nuclease subunit A